MTEFERRYKRNSAMQETHRASGDRTLAMATSIFSMSLQEPFRDADQLTEPEAVQGRLFPSQVLCSPGGSVASSTGIVVYNHQLKGDGGQGQNRTADTRIFSPLLYRLSYLASKRSLELEIRRRLQSRTDCEITANYRENPVLPTQGLPIAWLRLSHPIQNR